MRNIETGRRGFIKSALVLSGGLAMSSSALSGDLLFGKKEVRVGVIGTGDRGTGLIRLIKKVDGLTVTACADIIPFRLEQGVALAPGAKGYDNFSALLKDSNVDAVLITTPFSTHDEVALAALDARKHIYCEKTMVMGIDNIQKVIDKASRTDVVFQTGHQYHSSQLYNRAREIVQSGYIGELTAFECQWNRNGNWRRPVPDPKLERLINWRMYREYSGGLVAELMSHQIDFVNWVTESVPSKIVGFGGIDHWKDGRETYDNVHMLFEYPSGMDATFTCTTTNAHEGYEIKILGSKATIILQPQTGTIHLEKKGIADTGLVDGVSGATIEAWKAGKGTPIDAPGIDPTLDALSQFYQSIVNGSPVVSDIQTGAQTAKCVQISLDSLRDQETKYWKDYPELTFG